MPNPTSSAAPRAGWRPPDRVAPPTGRIDDADGTDAEFNALNLSKNFLGIVNAYLERPPQKGDAQAMYLDLNKAADATDFPNYEGGDKGSDVRNVMTFGQWREIGPNTLRDDPNKTLVQLPPHCMTADDLCILLKGRDFITVIDPASKELHIFRNDAVNKHVPGAISKYNPQSNAFEPWIGDLHTVRARGAIQPERELSVPVFNLHPDAIVVMHASTHNDVVRFGASDPPGADRARFYLERQNQDIQGRKNICAKCAVNNVLGRGEFTLQRWDNALMNVWARRDKPQNTDCYRMNPGNLPLAPLDQGVSCRELRELLEAEGLPYRFENFGVDSGRQDLNIPLDEITDDDSGVDRFILQSEDHFVAFRRDHETGEWWCLDSMRGTDELIRPQDYLLLKGITPLACSVLTFQPRQPVAMQPVRIHLATPPAQGLRIHYAAESDPDHGPDAGRAPTSNRFDLARLRQQDEPHPRAESPDLPDGID